VLVEPPPCVIALFKEPPMNMKQRLAIIYSPQTNEREDTRLTSIKEYFPVLDISLPSSGSKSKNPV
jgi:hypothetical protein